MTGGGRVARGRAVGLEAVPYQDLRTYRDAPMMLGGYLTTIVVALVPPLWRRLMTPRVLAWNRDFATDAERALITSS